MARVHPAATKFAQELLENPSFQNRLRIQMEEGTAPPGVVAKLMEYAWGKPPETVEVTGEDGKPIETLTRIERVIVPRQDPE